MPDRLLQDRKCEEADGRITTVERCGGEPLNLIERIDAWLVSLALKMAPKQQGRNRKVSFNA
jgi:hypothetical protein